MHQLLRMDPRERLTWHGMLTHPFFEGMEGYDARAPGGPNAERAEDAEKAGADVHAKRGTTAGPRRRRNRNRSPRRRRRRNAERRRARENATRLRREREAAEAEAREREKELARRENARGRNSNARRGRRRNEKDENENARRRRARNARNANARRRGGGGTSARGTRTRPRTRTPPRTPPRALVFRRGRFPIRARRRGASESRRAKGRSLSSDPDRDPPSFSAADPARPARLPRISRLDARRSETGSVARGSRRASRREISSDAFADDFPSARAGAHAGTGSNRRANAAFDEAFGLGLRGIEFGAASRRGERRPVAGRRAARGRDSGVGDADDLGALLHASKIGSREVHIGSRAHRIARGADRVARGAASRGAPSNVRGGFGCRARVSGGASAGARGPTRGVASRGGWRTRDGERDDATRRGTGRGRGPGGGARPQLRFGGGDAGAERGGGFDRSKYVVPPVPTYEERRVARRTREGRRDGDEEGGDRSTRARQNMRGSREVDG